MQAQHEASASKVNTHNVFEDISPKLNAMSSLYAVTSCSRHAEHAQQAVPMKVWPSQLNRIRIASNFYHLPS